MAANRKLVQQVDSTLKKIEEGLQEFDDLWKKAEETSNANQRVCPSVSYVFLFYLM